MSLSMRSSSFRRAKASMLKRDNKSNFKSLRYFFCPVSHVLIEGQKTDGNLDTGGRRNN